MTICLSNMQCHGQCFWKVNKLMGFNFSVLILIQGSTRKLKTWAAFYLIPGRIDPVSWYLLSILETHPWLTRSWREMTQGRTPAAAISMILRRMWLGSGRPLMNTPPNWFTRPCPVWMGIQRCYQFHLWLDSVTYCSVVKFFDHSKFWKK